MLLLLDLDNTLIDRTAAFKAWAGARFGESELSWPETLAYRPTVTAPDGAAALRALV